jgi:hypothetical protein
VPADRRPPGAPARPGTRRGTRRAAADASSPLERMWALVLRRFRDHVHSDNPTKGDDERT